MRAGSVFGAVCGCAAILFVSSGARAEAPQFGVGFTVGAAGVGRQDKPWQETMFHLGARGDMLFGRNGSNGFGVGPYLEVMTHDFGELQTGGGASVLFPVMELFPIVLSGGGYVRIPWRSTPGPIAESKYGVEPGLAASIFLGTRSYNFSNSYEITVGLLGEARVGLGESHETSFVVAAQLDFAALWVPVVFIVHGLQESPEAQRIK
ncbi:MAG: hypothetical protein U0441_02080 [Polyangiaceae bacterium]